MHLYLIRHGESEEGKPDPERALTPLGKARAEAMAVRICKLPHPPLRIFASPLLRARETAAPFALGWRIPVETAEWLFPLTAPSHVLKILEAFPQDPIALVGHLPHLGLLLAALTQGLPAREIPLSKGSVSFLSVKAWEPLGGELEWQLSPDSIDEGPKPR